MGKRSADRKQSVQRGKYSKEAPAKTIFQVVGLSWVNITKDLFSFPKVGSFKRKLVTELRKYLYNNKCVLVFSNVEIVKPETATTVVQPGHEIDQKSRYT